MKTLLRNLTILCMAIAVMQGLWTAQNVGIAQTTDETHDAAIKAKARVIGNAVILRWAPDKPGAWQMLNKTGYSVARVQLDEKGKTPVGDFRELTASPILPWTVEEWKRRFDANPSDLSLAAAAQMLYGKAFGTTTTGDDELGAMKKTVNEQYNRHGFGLYLADVHPLAAEGLGLRLTDSDVQSGAKYIYRIAPAKENSKYSIDTAFVVVTVEADEGVPSVPGLRAEAGDGKISLLWDELPGEKFTAYNVYRSDDNGRTYNKLNKLPFLFISQALKETGVKPNYTDSGLVNYRKYRYQVQGINAFGQLSPAAEIEAAPRDLTPPAAATNLKAELTAGGVRVTWTPPAASGDLDGVFIGRSHQSRNETEFRWISQGKLDASTREFLDSKPTEDEPYYIISAVDTAGNIASSHVAYAIILDTVPPSPPTGIKGRIDTTGLVTIRWSRKTGKHMLGYRVLWANNPTHTFAMATPTVLEDTVFTMKVDLNTLTEDIYFQVVSVNDRKLHGEPSEILALHKPDKVPPVAPTFRNVEVTSSSVFLRWNRSSSADLEKQILLRRVQGEESWKEIAMLDAVRKEFVDTDVTPAVTYEYRLVAVDDAGLRTNCAMDVAGRPYDTGMRPGVSDVNAQYDEKERTITLTWKLPEGAIKEDYSFVIYRATGEGRPTQYQVVDAKQLTFKDALVAPKETYRYGVMVRTGNGGESPLSQIVSATVQK